MKKIFLPTLFVLVGFVSACSTNEPSDLIPREKYINVLADLELTKAYYQASHDSAKADSIRLQVYQHYHITTAQYIRSRDYYQRTGQEHDILKKALDQLSHERDKITNFIKQKVDTSKKVLKRKSELKDTTGAQ